MLWDIFCRVIDNFGDIGVCWRLCADLAHRGENVRLWVDDVSALEWMAPGAIDGTWPGIQVLQWQESTRHETLENLVAAEVWVEAFGCEISPEFIDSFAKRSNNSCGQRVSWINLEYLSAEPFVERVHCLPSPVMQGPAKGWLKHFFYPGFTPLTGGLLREPDLTQRQQTFDLPGSKTKWLSSVGLETQNGPFEVEPSPSRTERLISLFCYEPAGLADLLEALAHDSEHNNHLLVTPGRAMFAVQALLGSETRRDNLRISYLPELTQLKFDELLWHCDINFIRGEDSLVRAIWAGKPFVWHIYPQDDGAHIAKLRAFLTRIGAGASTCALHELWNCIAQDASTQGPLTLPVMSVWQEEVRALKSELWNLPDLTGTLIQFARKNR